MKKDKGNDIDSKILPWTIGAFIGILIFLLISNKCDAQRWKDTNRGLYPQSLQVSVNAKNSAVGGRYGYLFQNPVLDMPLGVYASFSNTISPNPDHNNYAWERKYSLGGMITLPHNMDSEAHTFFTLGVVRNSHPDAFTTSTPGQYEADVYETANWGCDIGIEMQQKHFKAHLTVDVVNWMRYVEFGCGVTFFRIRK